MTFELGLNNARFGLRLVKEKVLSSGSNVALALGPLYSKWQTIVSSHQHTKIDL